MTTRQISGARWRSGSLASWRTVRRAARPHQSRINTQGGSIAARVFCRVPSVAFWSTRSERVVASATTRPGETHPLFSDCHVEVEAGARAVAAACARVRKM